MDHKLAVVFARLFNLGNQDEHLLQPVRKLKQVVVLEEADHPPVRIRQPKFGRIEI